MLLRRRAMIEYPADTITDLLARAPGLGQAIGAPGR
jgi:hypothetical protein